MWPELKINAELKEERIKKPTYSECWCASVGVGACVAEAASGGGGATHDECAFSGITMKC